jgi:RimJ/RimL family protein N-acetyltransferase
MMIETPNLLLREVSIDDLDALHSILSDAETMSFWPRPFTRDETLAWIERSIASYADHGFGRYAVVLKESGEIIGDCGIIRTTVNGTPANDIGYIIHRDHWGNGYATEAARAVMEHAFTTLGLDTLLANMAHDNHPSRRVAEKLGMTKIGEFNNERNRGILTNLYVMEGPERV